MRVGRPIGSGVKSAYDRVMAKVEMLPDAPGCWLYTGSLTQAGYGQVFSRELGRPTTAHRIVYAASNGSIPDHLEIDHLCRTRSCCNPAHLELVLPRVNWERGYSLPRLNALKTHCSNGHTYDAPNTRMDYLGGRHCRVCQKILNAGRNPLGNKTRAALNAIKTSCPKGHEYNSENTAIRLNGSRRCRACHRIDEVTRRNSAHGTNPVRLAVRPRVQEKL